MCLIVLAWRARADLPLVVAANRDEWRERPAEPAHWWPDAPGLCAGRDQRAGGTWMGMTRGGRFAAITNFRDPSDRKSTAPSRGELVTRFLRSSDTPEAFFSRLTPHASLYNGFNLIAGDGTSLWCLSSREGTAREIPPGIHGLSNHVLDEPWPKVIGARAAMAEALQQADPEPRLEAFMGATDLPHDDELPRTGVPLDWERRLAPALITGDDYGTRCSTFVRVEASGRWRLRELTRGANGEVVSAVHHDNQGGTP